MAGGAAAYGLGLRTEDEYEIALQPFQLKLKYNNNSSALTSEDEMTILETAQSFVTDQLSDEFSSFLRLAFFQYVRDFPETEERFSKVAWGGFTFFYEPNIDPTLVQTEIYLSFLGDNKLDFLSTLHTAGLESVVNVSLMSIDGTELEYRDGTIAPVIQPSAPSAPEETGISKPSEDDISIDDPTTTTIKSNRETMGGDGVWKKTILLSLLIPLVVLCFACSVHAYRSLKEINWEDNAGNEDASVWHSSKYSNGAAKKARKMEKHDDLTLEESESQRRSREEAEDEEEGKSEDV